MFIHIFYFKHISQSKIDYVNNTQRAFWNFSWTKPKREFQDFASCNVLFFWLKESHFSYRSIRLQLPPWSGTLVTLSFAYQQNAVDKRAGRALLRGAGMTEVLTWWERTPSCSHYCQPVCENDLRAQSHSERGDSLINCIYVCVQTQLRPNADRQPSLYLSFHLCLFLLLTITQFWITLLKPVLSTLPPNFCCWM